MQAHEMIQRTKRSAAQAGALALLTLSPFLGSCASTGASAEELEELGAVRASMIDFNSRTALTLVNETYATQMAGEAVDLGTKVSADVVLGELAKFYDEEGFWDVARPGDPGGPGSSPTDGGQPVALAFTFQSEARSGWLPLRAGIGEQEMELIQVLGSNFTALWNNVENYRSVYNPSGKAVFRQPTYE